MKTPNYNTFTRATNLPRVSLEFHVPFWIIYLYPPAFCLSFVKKIFIIFKFCEGRVTYALLPFNLHSFVFSPFDRFSFPFSFFFLNKTATG